MERLTGMWGTVGEQSSRQAGLGASLRVPLYGQHRYGLVWVVIYIHAPKEVQISYRSFKSSREEHLTYHKGDPCHYSCPLSARREFSSPIPLWRFSGGDELCPKWGTKVWSEVSVLQSCAPGANGSYFLWAVHFTCSSHRLTCQFHYEPWIQQHWTASWKWCISHRDESELTWN